MSWSRCFNQLSAVAREQSWASWHMSGATMPTVGRFPAATSADSCVSGTSFRPHAVASADGVKYAHGLCFTAYVPEEVAWQFVFMPSA